MSHLMAFQQKGTQFKSFQHFILGIQYSLQYRKRLRKFLSSTECGLFGKSPTAMITLNHPAAVDRLVDKSGANFSTLGLCQELDSEGATFARFDGLIDAVAHGYQQKRIRAQVLFLLSQHGSHLFQDVQSMQADTPLPLLQDLVSFALETTPGADLLEVLNELVSTSTPLNARDFQVARKSLFCFSFFLSLSFLSHPSCLNLTLRNSHPSFGLDWFRLINGRSLS